jgi:hypothetical protein
MFFKRISFALFILFSVSAGAYAQAVHSPEKGSKERKEIVDALRAPVKKELRQDVIFVINDLNVSGTWAFLGGAPQTPEGGAPDYSGTVYAEEEENGAFDNNIFALLRKTGGKWKVVKYFIGCTDVCYATWWKEYKAPKAIFPYTE